MAEVIGGHYVLQDAGESRSGGLSTVRRGVDTRDMSSVAVKFIVGRDDQLQQKIFEREVKTLRSLEHKCIVPYRDSGIDETGTYYVVLGWVDRNLDDLLKNGPWPDWDRFYREFGRPLVHGLAYAHLKRVEHRDIKPANILVSDSGTPLLADFGIAKIRGEQDHSELTVAGFRSGPYAPPEMDSAIPYVRDVYSLGVLFLQCLSSEKIRDFPDIAPTLEAVNVPPDVRKMLARCVEHDPGDRPANATVVATEFDRIASGRAAQRGQASHWVVLGLTNKATEILAGGVAERAAAGSALESDLSGDVFATYKFDHDAEDYDRETVRLVGNEFVYTLKLNESRLGFVVTFVAQPEYEQLEGLRRRAAKLPPMFTWSALEPHNRDWARAGFDRFAEILDDHAEKHEIANNIEAGAADELLDLWQRILDAREDLARGSSEPLKIKRSERQRHLMRFELVSPVEADLIGTEWQVEDPISERTFGWGEVVDQDAHGILLLGSHLRTAPDGARLVPHIGPSEIALQRQREAITAVRAGTAVRPDLRELLADPSVAEPPAVVPLEDIDENLDASKREAVAAALGSQDILVVQGPPGTGKTSFIAETVARFLGRNPSARILIASQTHVAVDNALERLDSRGVTGLVRLAGRDDSAVQPSVRHLLLDEQTRRWSEKVRRRAEVGLQKRASEFGVDFDELRAALTLQELADVLAQLEAIESRLQMSSEEESWKTDLATVLEIDDRAGLQDRVDTLSDRKAELVLEARAALAGLLTMSEDPDSAEARAAVGAIVGDSESAAALLEQLKIQANWLQRIGSDESIAAVFLDSTSVVAGTCVGFLRNRAVRLLEFDLCIVDEASKATITEVLVPMVRAKQWILVGDTRQLPPTDEDLLRAEDILREHELTPADVTQTLFQRLADQLPEHSQRTLSEQYRMIRPIGDLISTCFYDGGLRSPRTEGIKGYEQCVGKPVMWLDTHGLGERRRESGQGGQGRSFANRTEAQAVLDHLRHLDRAIDSGWLRPEEGRLLDVLVVAPYRSQVDELRRRLAPITLKHLTAVVMSVDSVQGREADIAVLSLTRSNPQGRLGFLGAAYWRRINVALSRARFGLTIIGDADFIGGTRGALRSVADYIASHPEDCEVRRLGDG